MKAINDEVAIHDDGFQFYLLLNVRAEINKLIKELLDIEKCMEYHKETKLDKECTWYNAKTKLKCWTNLEGYSNYSSFTSKEINSLYKERKSKYDFLIEMAENALTSVKRNYEKDKKWRVPSGLEDRSDILIDHVEIDNF